MQCCFTRGHHCVAVRWDSHPPPKWPPCWLLFSASQKKIQARIAAQTQSGAAKASDSDGGGGGGVSGSGARRGQQKHKDIIRETVEMSRRRVNTHTARLN